MASSGILHLVAHCYTEGKNKRTQDIAKTNPFPPFSNLANPWEVYLEFYRGNHWSRSLVQRMASHKSRPHTNFCFRGVETYSTLLTDNRTMVGIGPVEPDDTQLAEVISAGVERWQEQQGWDAKDLFCTRDSRIFGLGWYHLDGLDFKVVAPQHIITDPDCTMHDFDPTWLIYEFKAQVGDLQKKYKELDGKKIEWDQFSKDWKPNDPESATRTDSRFADTKDYANPAESCTVIQFWTKDDTKIKWDEDAGESVVTKRKKKYPKGRLVTIAGGLVLEDRDNPFDHGEFPFTPLPAYATTDRFYPAGDIENIINLQVSHNRMAQFLFDGTEAAGGGIFLCNPNYGLSMEQLTNAPVGMYDVEDVERALRVERPSAPSRHVYDFMATIEAAINDILGLHDISYGKRTPGNPVTAQEASLLADSDKTRVRAAARLKAAAHRRIYRQLLHNFKQYGKEEWIVQIAGEDGEALIETFKGDLITKEILDRDISIAGGADSMLPSNYQELVMLANDLYDRGLIDEEEYLKRIHWPDYKRVAANSPAKAEREKELQAPPPQPQAMPPLAMPVGPMPGPMPPAVGPEMMPGAMPVDPMAQGAPPELEQMIRGLVEQAVAAGVPPEQIPQMIGMMLSQTQGG